MTSGNSRLKRSVSSAFVVAAGMLCAEMVWAETIHLMARKGDTAKVLEQIENGVAVDLPSTRHTTIPGVTPLYVAAKFGRVDIVKVLLEAGADPNFTRSSAKDHDNEVLGAPLHAAAGAGHLEVVRLLIDAGADPTLDDPDIGTPLHLARRRNHEEIASLLLANGATERVEAPSVAHLIASADVEHGRVLSNACAFCHSLDGESEEIIIGPSLWNVVGRSVGAVAAFDYSTAMASHGGNWDYDALNSHLASPMGYLPGTKMEVSGVGSAQSRADIIAYLRTLSKAPVPLP